MWTGPWSGREPRGLASDRARGFCPTQRFGPGDGGGGPQAPPPATGLVPLISIGPASHAGRLEEFSRARFFQNRMARTAWESLKMTSCIGRPLDVRAFYYRDISLCQAPAPGLNYEKHLAATFLWWYHGSKVGAASWQPAAEAVISLIIRQTSSINFASFAEFYKHSFI